MGGEGVEKGRDAFIIIISCFQAISESWIIVAKREKKMEMGLTCLTLGDRILVMSRLSIVLVGEDRIFVRSFS